MTDLKLLKKLRQETQAGIADIKNALLEAKNNEAAAKKILHLKGLDKANKKADRVTSSGVVESYVHNNKNSGAMVVLTCETDFVARNVEFQKLAHEIAMQVTAMEPKNVDELLKQEWIKDSSLTIENLIKTKIAQFGENIKIKEIGRFRIK